MWRQGSEVLDEGVAQCPGVLAGQVDELDEAGLSFDQRADRGPMSRSNDQVPFPCTGVRAVIGCEGSLVDAQSGCG